MKIWIFIEFLEEYGFVKIDEVLLSSGIDESVVFIGSHISVLKPYFLSGNFAGKIGITMKQECIRTHNLKTLFDDSIIPKWGSCFTSLGSIAKPNGTKESCEILLKYLTEGLHIPLDNILIRISSEDVDLLEALKSSGYNGNIEFDSRNNDYYKHKLGLGNITGRNFNIALRHGDLDIFNDIGNIILIEDENKVYTTEIALGFNTILMELYGLDNIFQTTVLEKYYNINSGLHPKLKDCIISAIHLLNEGLKPRASNYKGRILRKYLRGILYFIKKIGLDMDSILKICENYEKDSFGTIKNTNFIREYILSYKNELSNKINLSEEDKIIKDLL